VAPVAASIKKTPDISDITGERAAVHEENGRKGEEEKVRKGEEEKGRKGEEEKGEETGKKENLSREKGEETGKKENLSREKGVLSAEQWGAMFEKVFASVPTIYIPLKEILPEIDNNIIKVVVKNEIQKEHFEAKTREVLAFLRTHYDEHIEEIIVETNESLETKKIIYDDKDKLQNFKEQNEEFEDFVQILELAIKG
jgi:hypothetical protein